MRYQLIVLLVLGTWLGMLIGISFVEAPLKFRAPNMTLPLGLGIGRLVFGVLNKFELFFSVGLLMWAGFYYYTLDLYIKVGMILIITMVFMQTIWLLPVLDARADRIIKGLEVVESRHHYYYVAMECTKAGLLLLAFIKIYQYDRH